MKSETIIKLFAISLGVIFLTLSFTLIGEGINYKVSTGVLLYLTGSSLLKPFL